MAWRNTLLALALAAAPAGARQEATEIVPLDLSGPRPIAMLTVGRGPAVR